MSSTFLLGNTPTVFQVHNANNKKEKRENKCSALQFGETESDLEVIIGIRGFCFGVFAKNAFIFPKIAIKCSYSTKTSLKFPFTCDHMVIRE